MRKIYLIVIHCSATRVDADYPLSALAEDHRKAGFKGIGYHYYIRKDGTLQATRSLVREGAHVRGWNKHSIGICYEGGLDENGRPCDTRTPAQRSALRALVARLIQRFGGDIRVCGHRDLSPDLNGNGVVEPTEWVKQCPCFDVATEL